MILRSEEAPGVILLAQAATRSQLYHSSLTSIRRGYDTIKLHTHFTPGQQQELPRMHITLQLAGTRLVETYTSVDQLQAAYERLHGPDTFKAAQAKRLAADLAALTPEQRAALFSPYCGCGQSKPCW